MTASVVDGRPSKLPPGQAWLLLPASAVAALHIASGEHVMVSALVWAA